MPRTQSAFNLLKRVGFALLLLVTISSGRAQGPDTLWMKLYCPDSTFLNYIYEMDVVNDDEILVMGKYVLDIDESHYFYLSRFDSDGNFLYRSSFGWEILSGDFTKVAEGVYGVTGSAWESDGINWYAAQFGEDGSVLWERTLSMPDEQVLPQVCGTGDGGMLVVSGDQGPTFGYSFACAKYNAEGDTVFTRRIVYGQEGIGIWDVAMTNDNGFAVVGNTDTDGLLLKLNSEGYVEYERHYQYRVSTGFRYVSVLPDGDFIITGGLDDGDFGEPLEPFVIRVAPEGEPLWTHVENLPDSVYGYWAGYVTALPDGGFILASPTADNGAVIRYDRNNIEQWRQNYYLENPRRGTATAFALRSNSGFAVVGHGQCPDDYSLDAISLFATEPDPYILDAQEQNPELPQDIALSLAPNPFNLDLRISFVLPRSSHVNLRVYDTLGRLQEELLSTQLGSGSHQVLWEANEASSGVYFIQMKSETSCQTAKAVLLK